MSSTNNNNKAKCPAQNVRPTKIDLSCIELPAYVIHSIKYTHPCHTHSLTQTPCQIDKQMHIPLDDASMDIWMGRERFINNIRF